LAGAWVLEKSLELVDGVYRLAARTLPPGANAEVTHRVNEKNAEGLENWSGKN